MVPKTNASKLLSKMRDLINRLVYIYRLVNLLPLIFFLFGSKRMNSKPWNLKASERWLQEMHLGIFDVLSDGPLFSCYSFEKLNCSLVKQLGLWRFRKKMTLIPLFFVYLQNVRILNSFRFLTFLSFFSLKLSKPL